MSKFNSIENKAGVSTRVPTGTGRRGKPGPRQAARRLGKGSGPLGGLRRFLADDTDTQPLVRGHGHATHSVLAGMYRVVLEATEPREPRPGVFVLQGVPRYFA